MKFVFCLLAALVTASCTNAAENEVDSSIGQSDVHAALEMAVSNTPYSALVRLFKIERTAVPDDDTSDDLAEDQLTVHAQVLETFKGPKLKQLRYAMVVERGEAMDIPKEPVIVTLCKEDEQYYWPGTGSSFPADTDLVRAAVEAAEKSDGEQSDFTYCQ